jgi:hypothetical protein
MVLTRWFSRSLVLIALAASFGMLAQEMVSRMLMANDQPVAMTSSTGPTWESAESFYGHHPGVFRQPSIAAAETPLTDTIDTPTETAEVDSFVAKQSSRPETIDSAESVTMMAQSSPEPVLIASMTPEQPLADEPAAAPIVPPESADSSPELPERRPPTIPDFAPAQAAELPPPEPRKPEVDEPLLPEVYLPPQRPRTPPVPAGIADSAPAPNTAAYPVASPHDASRYVDPAELVRQRGIERGQQLQRRLEARRMMGYHSLRPPVEASPYSSGNPIRPVVIVVPRTVVVQQR